MGDNLIDRRLRGRGSRRGLAEQAEALAAAVVRVADRGVRRDQLAEQPLESAGGVEAELALEPGYPLLVNDPACAEAVRRVAAQVPGIERVSDAELPMAGGEDFAYFAQARPSAYFFLGAGRGPDTPGCHHADFDFDEALIPLGIETFVRLAEGGGRTA